MRKGAMKQVVSGQRVRCGSVHREEVAMSEKVYKVLPSAKKNALIDNDTYLKWYKESVTNPDKFWGKHGKRI